MPSPCSSYVHQANALLPLLIIIIASDLVHFNEGFLRFGSKKDKPEPINFTIEWKHPGEVKFLTSLESDNIENEQQQNNKYPPRVPNPKLPALPREFTDQVDVSCQSIVYNGFLHMANVSDHSIIDFFGGCKPVSMGYCHSEYPPFVLSYGTLFFYQRSEHGIWMAMGRRREIQHICTTSLLEEGNALLQILWEKMLSIRHQKPPKNGIKQWLLKNVDKLDSRLPRLADLPEPAPLPDTFTAEYGEQCRIFGAKWNVNMASVTDESYYANCNVTGNYCAMAEQKTNAQQVQTIKLRSDTVAYAYMGLKFNAAYFPFQIPCTFE